MAVPLKSDIKKPLMTTLSLTSMSAALTGFPLRLITPCVAPAASLSVLPIPVSSASGNGTAGSTSEQPWRTRTSWRTLRRTASLSRSRFPATKSWRACAET